MAKVNWEIWAWAVQEDGGELHMLALAGPDGDDSRAMNEPSAKLLHEFAAGSRFEAMSYYHQYLGREPYTANYAEDFASFTQEQADRQRSGEPIGSGFGEGAP